MRTLKLTIAYDGTRFVGWQRQAEGISIQGLLEEALARFEGGPVAVHGAGRTDAGVHALGQVASATIGSTHDLGALLRGLNAQLPPDVRVVSVEDVAGDFHARFSASSKTYRYLIHNAPFASPFERGYAWHIPEPLDLAAMERAARLLEGTHDFAAFGSSGGAAATTRRTVYRSRMVRFGSVSPRAIEAGDSGALLAYEVEGSGFLRHMVRAITGTLVEIGRGRRTVDSVAALVAGATRADAGPTAPPHGLYLVRVEYDR